MPGKRFPVSLLLPPFSFAQAQDEIYFFFINKMLQTSANQTNT